MFIEFSQHPAQKNNWINVYWVIKKTNFTIFTECFWQPAHRRCWIVIYIHYDEYSNVNPNNSNNKIANILEDLCFMYIISLIRQHNLLFRY